MTISLAKSVQTPFGFFPEALPVTTVFVLDDTGRWHANPTIIEEDEDCVVFEVTNAFGRVEQMGRAVALPCLTPQEALEVARQHRLELTYNNRFFCWSQPTRKRMSEWCAGFRKQRGTRTHLIPATLEQCIKLIEGRLKISYTTYSNRCQFVLA